MDMKKRFWVLVLMMALLLSACGGRQWTRSISIRDGDSKGDQLEIPIRACVSGSPTHKGFHVKQNFEELVDKVTEAVSPLAVKEYQEKYIEIRTDTNVFLIQKADSYEREGGRYYNYHLLRPRADFLVEELPFTMYIPLHLLYDVDHPYIDAEVSVFPQTMECEALGTVEEFYDFYDHIARCEVTREGDALRVSHRDGGTLVLTFAARDGKTFVTFEGVATEPW